MKAETASIATGDQSQDLLELTIGDALARTAATWPDRLALVSVAQDIRWTWRELAGRVEYLAARLLALGLAPGDRVGIWSPNRAEWTLTQLATARIGLILVTINPANRVAELEYALNKVGVRALVVAERFKGSDYIAMVEELVPEMASGEPNRIVSSRIPSLEMAITLGEPHGGWLSFQELALGGEVGMADIEALMEISQGLGIDDPVNIQFTSGTTGLPKGATLTHRNILNNGFFVGRAVGLTPDDALCIPVPLYHCFGMVMGVLACVAHGAAMVFPSEGFDPVATLAAVASERCTALYGVPTMFIAMLGVDNLAEYDLSSLRKGCMAGSPCPEEIMEQVMDRMNMRDITIAYGMTETSPVSFQTAPDDTLEQRVKTIGRVQPHLEVKLIDADGATVPRGQPGELCTRGYSVMKGYWNDHQLTAHAIDADGWMHSGDLAVMDEDGYARIVGRRKDMVIRGGENIYPREIEEFLLRCPGVADVQVVGVPDERFGEELCAWVQLKSGHAIGADELVDFCRGSIAHYKIPRYIRFVEEFPLTVTGKVKKHEIRHIMSGELDRARASSKLSGAATGAAQGDQAGSHMHAQGDEP